MRNIRLFATICVLLLPLSACALFPKNYHGAPIEGWVVDKDTKEPIVGVSVFIRWELYAGLHYDRIGDLLVMETVTDEDGRYVFDAWGPLKAKKGELSISTPHLVFFKLGYLSRSAHNEHDPDSHRQKIRGSDWNGKTIEISKNSYSIERYARHTRYLGSLINPYPGDPCVWQKVPIFTAQIIKLRDQLDKHKLGIYLPSDQELGLHCDDPQQVLRELLYN